METFQVREVHYSSFYQVFIPVSSNSSPCRNIWQVQASLRAIFFSLQAIFFIKKKKRAIFFFYTWKTFRNVLTMDNLMKLHIITTYWCSICRKSGEYVDHILLHCHIARVMWNDFFGKVWFAWVMYRKFVDLFANWRNLEVHKLY